jgi:thiol-disulfide isomerase/thioredoxin
MKKLFLLTFLTSLLFTSCDSSETSVEKKEVIEKPTPNIWLNGTVSGGANNTIILEQYTQQGAILLEKSNCDKNGNYTISTAITSVGIFQLRLNNDNAKVVTFTMSPNDKIDITSMYEGFERNTRFKGASWCESLNNFYQLMEAFMLKKNEIESNDKLSADEKLKATTAAITPITAFAKESAIKDPKNLSNLMLSSLLMPSQDISSWDTSNLELLQRVEKELLLIDNTSISIINLSTQIRQIEAMSAPSTDNTANEKAPDFTLNTPEGKPLSLSSLKGKVVLIDFWASWCRPCRAANPEIVALYTKYKTKKFTVLSVSLDSDLESWKKAIASDGLIWPNHVSDLKQWDTPMTQLYNFNSIPHTVLVDKNGIIIGNDLHGPALEQKLISALKN